MKFSIWFSVFCLCFVMISCGSDEDDLTCVTVLDCPGSGYSCINNVCQHQDETVDNSDSVSEDGTGIVTSDGTEEQDDVQGCPNACSGFGDCDFETKTCTCTQNHGGADCSECAEGYHLESEDYDEDGNPNIRSCVYNVTCDPNPCNGGKCTAQENTVKCECLNHTAGTFCDTCEDGYLKSANDGECKPDCSKITCDAPKICGINYTTNEAGCNDPCGNPHYSGDDCKSCDVDYFCSGHGTACVVEGGTEKCTCANGYTGSKCEKKSCTAEQCFQSFSCTGPITGIPYSVSGHCNPSTCECDQGWLTATSAYGEGETVYCKDLMFGAQLDSRANVLCTVCDVDNPPAEYASTGCPTDCYKDFCNGTDTANGQGSCYIEKGTNKVYCKCASGYTMTGGSQYYDENDTGQCE